MASKHQEIDTSSGRATKDDMAELKRQARENEQAYKEGYEDAGDTDSGSGGSSHQLPSLSGLPKAFSLRTDSQKLILVSLTATGIVSLIEEVSGKQKGNAGTIIVGTFVSGAILLGMSYFVPEFASGLAIIVLAVTVLEKGKPFWDVVGGAVGHPITPNVTSPISDMTGSAGITLIPNAGSGATGVQAPATSPQTATPTNPYIDPKGNVIVGSGPYGPVYSE